MGMIVVEGPDGSGKSSLVDYLTHRFDLVKAPRLAHSLFGPINDLADGVMKALEEQQGCETMVYDRFAPISEAIYGSVVRQEIREGFDGPFMAHAWKQLMQHNPLFIFCLPPYSTVVANLREVDQMDGVMEHLYEVYHLYAAQAFTLQGLLGPHRVLIYNYTVNPSELPTPSFARFDLDHVIFNVSAHLEGVHNAPSK
jgi:hypothetical protein